VEGERAGGDGGRLGSKGFRRKQQGTKKKKQHRALCEKKSSDGQGAQEWRKVLINRVGKGKKKKLTKELARANWG